MLMSIFFVAWSGHEYSLIHDMNSCVPEAQRMDGRTWAAWVLFPTWWPWAKSLNHSVPWFSDSCDEYQVTVPSSQGYGASLINELVICFEIHLSDRSACTIKALVCVLIYVQIDYSWLLTLSSQACLLCFCLTPQCGHVFCPFSSFLYCPYFLHCVKHGSLYCHHIAIEAC